MRFVSTTTLQPVKATYSCLENLKTNVNSYDLLWNKLKTYGLTSVNLRTINQDPLENFFGMTRSHGFWNVKPSSYQFASVFKALLITNLASAHSPGSNCMDEGSSFLMRWEKYWKEVQHEEVSAVKISTASMKMPQKGSYICTQESVMRRMISKIKAAKCHMCNKFFSSCSNSTFGGLFRETKSLLKNLLPHTFDMKEMKRYCLFIEENFQMYFLCQT